MFGSELDHFFHVQLLPLVKLLVKFETALHVLHTAFIGFKLLFFEPLLFQVFRLVYFDRRCLLQELATGPLLRTSLGLVRSGPAH